MVLDVLSLVTGSPEASGFMKDDRSQERELSLLRKWEPRQPGSYQVAFVKSIVWMSHIPRSKPGHNCVSCLPLQTVSSQELCSQGLVYIVPR